jgi:hypothetical protein
MVDVERTFDPIGLIGVLIRHEVDFIVIGGLAGTLHGSPLVTGDLDVCPSTKTGNKVRLARALVELDAKEYDVRKDIWIGRDWSSEMLEVDTTWILTTLLGRLDLLFQPAGTSGYEDLKRRQAFFSLGDHGIAAASVEDLIRMKEAAGRPRDVAAVPILRKLLSAPEPDGRPSRDL